MRNEDDDDFGDGGDFDANAYENRMAGSEKQIHNFFGVSVVVTHEEWNQIFLKTIEMPEWVENLALTEAIQAMHVSSAADFREILHHTRRANETYRTIAKRVYDLARKIAK